MIKEHAEKENAEDQRIDLANYDVIEQPKELIDVADNLIKINITK